MNSLLGSAAGFRPAIFALVICGTLGPVSSASAHKLFVFATVQERHLNGEVYYHEGDPAAGARVLILAPDGRRLGETTTDAQGRFTYDPRERCDHRLVADVGLGHAAEYTVSAAELPAELPTQSVSPPSADHEHAADHQHPAEPDLAGDHEHVADHQHVGETPRDGSSASLDAQTRALSEQVAALRRDLDKWRAQLRVQDLLGGVGYILGIMGTVFYFLGVRHTRSQARSEASERSKP